MSDYVEKTDLYGAICKKVNNPAIRSWLGAIIAEYPAIDVAPVKHGKWILEREPDGKPYCFHCSVCDDDFRHIGILTADNYCPNCGAKMDL